MIRPLQTALCLLVLASSSRARDPETDVEWLEAQALHRRGTEHFFAGRLKEALADWDGFIRIAPAEAPHHWQRGIALYYAERYDDGVAQFESHQTVNGRDVENAVWHFLCMARSRNGSVAIARKKLFPFAGDTRVPLKEVHQLFAGTATPGDVLAAAAAGAEGVALRNQLCYAHLYLGLYCEALGQDQASAAHLRKAAVDFRMDHYMGRVAQLHHALRSKQAAPGNGPPPR